MEYNGRVPFDVPILGGGPQKNIPIMPGCDVQPGINSYPHGQQMVGSMPNGQSAAKMVHFGGLTKLEHVAALVGAAIAGGIYANPVERLELGMEFAETTVNMAEQILAECHKQQWPQQIADAATDAPTE